MNARKYSLVALVVIVLALMVMSTWQMRNVAQAVPDNTVYLPIIMMSRTAACTCVAEMEPVIVEPVVVDFPILDDGDEATDEPVVIVVIDEPIVIDPVDDPVVEPACGHHMEPGPHACEGCGKAKAVNADPSPEPVRSSDIVIEPAQEQKGK